MNEEWEKGDVYFPLPPDDDNYGTVDYAVSRELGVSVQHVDEALVVAGKRPPFSWIG